MNEIVILTPTYNRAKTLPKLYESLKRQNNKNFDWWIIDDGSTDGTSEYIDRIIKESDINIKYIFQENGGKARALNRGFVSCDYASVFMIVDSDDYLLTSAVETVSRYMNQYISNNEVGALFFYYETKEGKLLKPSGRTIDNDMLMSRYQYNNQFKLNDGCICYLSRAVNKYRYPEFENEKYVGPTVVQMEMANEFKIVFSPEIVGVAEYLEGGLSESGRELRFKNPNGMMYYCKLMISHKAKWSTQMKYAISIWPYAKLANVSIIEVIKMVKRPILLLLSYVPGKLLSLYWHINIQK